MKTKMEKHDEPWEVMPGDHPIWIDIASSVTCHQFGRMRVARVVGSTYAKRIIACVNALEGINPEAVKGLLEAAKAAQCDCSPCLRESGHLIDCWFPALNQAIEDTTKVAN